MERKDDATEAIMGAFKPGLKYEGMLDYYSKWSAYDKDIDSGNYRGGIVVAEAMAEAVPENERSSFKILDIGAGTGFVGQELRKRGFNKIDALEPCKPMLEEAMKRGIYGKHHVFGVSGDGVDIEDDKYDGITSAGTFGENHIPCKALLDMIKVVKPGGFIVFAIRDCFLSEVAEYANRLEPYLDKLEAAGLWKKVSRVLRPNYCSGKEASVFTYKVTILGTKNIDI